MKTKLKIYVLLAGLFFASCASYYDHYTFTQTLETKAMVQNLFQRSVTEKYADNKSSVDELKKQLQTMFLYEQTKKDNLITQKMWEVHTAENSTLNDFFKLWKEQGTMSEAFIKDFTKEVSKSFDLMVDYEANKSKQTETLLSQVLTTLTQ